MTNPKMWEVFVAGKTLKKQEKFVGVKPPMIMEAAQTAPV